MPQPTCKERIAQHATSRLATLRRLWKALRLDPTGEGRTEDGETLYEYGLCFDYVAPNTFTGQRRGYFRYQLSWGGPSDEYRFYTDERYTPTRVEYWFLDWFDGAHKTYTKGPTFDFLCSLFDWMTAGDPGYLLDRDG